MTLVRVFLRGLVLVTVVACNTRQLALGHVWAALPVAFIISWLWWSNSSKDRPQVPGAAVAYGAGGAAGTVIGFYLAGLIGG